MQYITSQNRSIVALFTTKDQANQISNLMIFMVILFCLKKDNFTEYYSMASE